LPDDAKYDDFIDREAKGYRAGVRPPADAMWSRIEADVADAIAKPDRRISRHLPWIVAVSGMAAALVIGVAIGRRSPAIPPVQPGGTTQVAVGNDSARGALMRETTVNHLVQTEMFLTEVRADLKTGRSDPSRADRSRSLLARTRLLLANDASSAPAVERLLEDLELVLAEIAALPDTGLRRQLDARLLDDRLSAGTVLPRIRTIVPPPSATGGS
jgi:hypothetical protein